MAMLFAAAPLLAGAGAAGTAATVAGTGAAVASSGISISSILTGLGAVVSGVGMYKQGQDAAALAEYNQNVASQEAQAIKQKTSYDVELQKEKSKRLMSLQRVGYAKAGVDFTDSGTPLDVLLQQAKDSELDTLATEYSGNVAASKALSRGSMYGIQGSQSASASKIGAVGSIFNGIGKYYTGRTRLAWGD